MSWRQFSPAFETEEAAPPKGGVFFYASTGRIAPALRWMRLTMGTVTASGLFSLRKSYCYYRQVKQTFQSACPCAQILQP